MIYMVDIDETICETPNNLRDHLGFRDYTKAKPIKRNIERINQLYEEGHTIIYWTARGGVSKQDYYEFTLNQLKEWGCKFHELTTGTSPNPKPSFDLIVDDKAKRIEEL